MQNQQPPRRRRPMTPEERAMAAERRRQKEILRRRAMRRYYAFPALLGALALAALVGLFFLIKAAAGWARGGQAFVRRCGAERFGSAPPLASSGEPGGGPQRLRRPALWEPDPDEHHGTRCLRATHRSLPAWAATAATASSLWTPA